MDVFATTLLFGVAPEWLPIVYTVQVFYFLPLRVSLTLQDLAVPLMTTSIRYPAVLPIFAQGMHWILRN